MAEKNLGRVVGLSAYEVAKSNGFEGTESDWLASLKGDKGDSGMPSEDGSAGQVLMTDGQGGHYWGDTAPGNAIADVTLNESLSDETKNVLAITDYDDGVKLLELPRGTPALRVEVSVRDDPYTADKTAAELYAAYESGRTIICHLLTTSGDYDLPANSSHKGGNACGVSFHGVRSGWELSVSVGTEGVWFSKKTLAYADALPTTLPNPQPLTINGQSYDGSEAVELELSDGKDGQDGAPGKDGQDGTPGKDGVSPAVEISKTGTQTTITITDAQGVHTETINDGADGCPGADGYTPVRGEDYWTDEDKAEINDYIHNQMPDLSGYATEQYVAEEIAKAQLGGGGGTTTVTKTLTADDFEIGALSSSDASEIEHSKRLRTDYLECTKDEPYSVTGNGSDKYRVFFYDSGKQFVTASEFRKSDIADIFKAVSDADDTAYVRFVLCYADDSTQITEIADLADRFVISRTYEEETPAIDTSIIATKSDLEAAQAQTAQRISGEIAKSRALSAHYDGNFIPNDRFVRSIANLRDDSKAKDFTLQITNNSGKTIKNAAIAVGLHNTVGVNPANNNLAFQIYDDLFSEPTGIKVFDGSAELPYYIESESNCNYIVDKRIRNDQKTIAVFSDGKIAIYNSEAHRVQITADGGDTWTDICENITAWPYRVLTPDSQDNFFVASNDGKKLYKYTSADGYMSGTEVIDMSDTDTQIGSLLAEDGDGNLYLGTYQTIWHCVIRKSTDHGDTWKIVFDSTESQHVHNIYVNKKVTPNEIFIGLDNNQQAVQTYVSTDAGETWTLLNVPYGNNDNAFRYAGENFYIGCGERLYLGGSALYKTTDYNDPEAYYPLFDNGQGIRDVFGVVDGSDDVLIAGGCVDAAVNTQQLFLSEDRGETWKTVLMDPYPEEQAVAGIGLRTFQRSGDEIIAETSRKYALRFVYGGGAKTTLAIVKVGDIPPEGKTITLKTGYVASLERMEDVLTAYENIEGKVADICVGDGYVVDRVSNKRELTDRTELVNARVRLGQTSEYKILSNYAYRLNGSVNFGKLSRLDFTKGFTVSVLFRKEDGKTLEEYLQDSKWYDIFRSGDTRLVLQFKSLLLANGTTSIFGKMTINNVYFLSVDEDYVRVTVCVTNDDLPTAYAYTEAQKNSSTQSCTEYPITDKLCDNDFVFGCDGMPNIARLEIYNRVLSHGEIMALTNGCNLVTDGSKFN